MKRWTRAGLPIFVMTVLCTLQTPARADDDDHKRMNVTVAFGRGLNTNQPGNPVNHVVLPKRITVDQDGVVHLMVAGFHQPVVYKPGTLPETIAVPAAGTFINDPRNRFYQGINPAGGPLATPPTPTAADSQSNAANRVESVSFPASEFVRNNVLVSERADPGTYLVICNVRGHFLDGMWAFITVKGKDEDDDDDHDH
jgi:hypothetical protein